MGTRLLATALAWATAAIQLAQPTEALPPQSEIQALTDLFKDTNGPTWGIDNGWLPPTPDPCYWYGVLCSPDMSHVVDM